MVVVGLDEVGRGSWAGPVVAGAVILRQPIAGLKDSKQLTKLQRESLANIITACATATGLGWVQPSVVDKLGLTRAVRLAMQRALRQITHSFDTIIIDGTFNFFPEDPRALTLAHADSLEPSVSAASIIAKVARDQWMATEAAKQFPEYQFDKHVGYGTKLHHEMLKLHGVCSLHRLSYKPVQAVLGSVRLVGKKSLNRV